MAVINPEARPNRDGSCSAAPLPTISNKLGYTRRELSEALGVSIRTIARAERDGHIRALSTWRTKVYPHIEVERFLREQLWSPVMRNGKAKCK